MSIKKHKDLIKEHLTTIAYSCNPTYQSKFVEVDTRIVKRRGDLITNIELSNNTILVKESLGFNIC